MKLIANALVLWVSAGALNPQAASRPDAPRATTSERSSSSDPRASNSELAPTSEIIDFQLEAPTAVRARILDGNGSTLRTLALGLFAPGRHEVEWDGLDSAGRPLAAGVYTLELHLGAIKALRTIHHGY